MTAVGGALGYNPPFPAFGRTMDFIRGLHNLRPHHHGTVATIGNFDGVHRGHTHLIEHLAASAGGSGLRTTLVTFEPLPSEFFAGDHAPPRLTRLREKLELLAKLPVDQVLCLRFDARLAALSPEDFVRRVLVDGLGVRHLLVGDDFRFGHRRQGDFRRLAQLGQALGFTVETAPTLIDHGERISSTRIRAALAGGELDLAQRLLGHPYHMSGRVARGDQRGRELGFPTANVHLHRRNSPVRGVFAVEVLGVSDRPWPAVANVGIRPTVDGGRRALLEVHLLDFHGDLYGRHLQIRFCRFIRPERRFPDLAALRAQIAADVVVARDFFNEHQEDDYRERLQIHP